MKISILHVDYHRNGIGGAPFHAVVFRDSGPRAGVKLAVVFDQPWHTAVLDITKLADCDVQFGSNSWRGDQYEPYLRKAIVKHQAASERAANYIRLTEDEFDRRYTLRVNHLDPNATWAFGDGPGCLFGLAREELEFIMFQDPNAVWTLIDGEDGHQWVISGFHRVNRVGYLVSTVPAPDGATIEVRLDSTINPKDRR